MPNYLPLCDGRSALGEQPGGRVPAYIRKLRRAKYLGAARPEWLAPPRK